MKDLCFHSTFLSELMFDIRKEHLSQIKKWGIQDHSPFAWLAFTLEELGEVSQAIAENIYRGGSAEHVYHECIQVATLILKIAEMYKKGDQETQFKN